MTLWVDDRLDEVRRSCEEARVELDNVRFELEPALRRAQKAVGAADRLATSRADGTLRDEAGEMLDAVTGTAAIADTVQLISDMCDRFWERL